MGAGLRGGDSAFLWWGWLLDFTAPPQRTKKKKKKINMLLLKDRPVCPMSAPDNNDEIMPYQKNSDTAPE